MTGRTRWLVTGAHGQLGADLVGALAGQDVTAAGRAELDLSGDGVTAALRAWAGAGRGSGPLVVLNAAAWTDVDAAEADPAGAAAVNEHGPARLAAGCAELGATLVHVSTDYVFPGRVLPSRVLPGGASPGVPAACGLRPYEVDDPVRPLGVYGVTKEAGERAVRAATDRHYVVRTAWLYGGAGRNFVRTIAGLRHRRPTLDVVDDQVGSPTWSRPLAEGLVELARSGAPFGTYHCVGGGRASWLELARAVFEELGEDPERVRPCSSERFPRPAPRPAWSVLSSRSWTTAGLRQMSHWREQLRSAVQVDRSSLDRPYPESHE